MNEVSATGRQSSAPLRGIVIMVTACLLFPVGDTIAKHLVGTYHVLMILWLKYLFQTASVVLVILLTQSPRAFRSRLPRMQVGRGLAGIGSYGTFLFAISYIPLADALAIEFSSPMIVVALSAPLLGERVGGKRWAVVLAGFAGTLLIVRPGMGVVHWAATLMLFAAFCVALMQLMSAVLARVDHPMTSLFYLSLTGLVATSLPVPFFWELLDPQRMGAHGHGGSDRRLLPLPVRVGFPVCRRLAARSLHLRPDRWRARARYRGLRRRSRPVGRGRHRAGGGLRTLPRPHLSPRRPPLSEAGREQEGLLIPPQKGSESRQRSPVAGIANRRGKHRNPGVE